ncbi:unknown protein for iron-sulfur cluster formation sufE [Cyanidioschyzon merolae strain 10D]|jgi:sulfur transfer protein SufE/stress-induced morphogen|uniref:Fe-S metabolism associated domain-containing protein n=1 Tax=Cyanidioschyzon merolae (strain NIES-3377 / 10D) TaxID=280699 RepID=M1V747_CYAM1|nr:unknown protein for iron-sulfur cluster formation sufE [Cyanidioschyzon merolae strain 10D]BAM82760.1 unknown protein for iron-sulfur cluster formation sufE [Cyanidioschyzon merolae strain 10D]|eukprot:XP_005538796.1 unknown protein for iron-sulfur cluster formation sufE [Cyanidioschyzon merolae strain 10D]
MARLCGGGCSGPAFACNPTALRTQRRFRGCSSSGERPSFSQPRFVRAQRRRTARLALLRACGNEDPGNHSGQSRTTEKLQGLVDAFKKLGDQKLRVQQLLHMASTLPPFPRERRVLANRVRGCLSVVHVDAFLDKEGKVEFIGDSDSQLTKGLVAFLIRGLSGYSVEEVCAVTPDFIKESGLGVSLTPGRTNGFLNMLRTMQEKARMLGMGEANSMQSTANGKVSMKEVIENKLQVLKPDLIEIRDDSAKHRGHEGAHERRGETHFTIKIVSDTFKDMPEVKRHKLVYALLSEELNSRRIHALSIITLTPIEAHSGPGVA